MARWIIQVSKKPAPLYAALNTHPLEQVVVQADETLLNVFKEDKQCYMWLYCSGADSPEAALPNVKNIALYDYQNSRARSCLVTFLEDYRGYRQTDGYGAYDGLHQVTNVGCLAHTRRKFMDAKKLQRKGKSGKADKAQAKIPKLYGIESRLKGTSAETRKAERQQHAKPILNELYEWMTTQQVIESSPLGKAIKYTLGQWPKLIRYIDDGHLSIGNNRAERAIKPLVIGERTGYSRPPQTVLMRARCFTVSSRLQKRMGLSSMTIWSSVWKNWRKLSLVSMQSYLGTSSINNIALWVYRAFTF